MPQTCPDAVISPCRVQSLWGLIALLVGLALSVGVSIAAATTWTVCAGGCDYTSIKAAIAAPTTLDGDTLAIAAGTYTEAGIVVNKSLTLQGAGATSTIVQAASSKGTASNAVFFIPSGVTVTLQDLTVRYGRTPGLGGGLSNAGTLTLTRCTIRDNRSTYPGGGVYNTGTGTLTLSHSTVSGNRSTLYAGGLYNEFGTLTLTHSTVSGNTADQSGGLFNRDGTLTLTHSTVSDNTAARLEGGGLRNDGTLTITHSTVSGNTAARDYGGGLSNNGTLTLTHSTVSGNRARSGGGLYNDATLTLTSSIVANNPEGGDCLNGDYGALISDGYNLDSDGSCQLTAATDRPGTDPLLGPLQDNGGPTFTHALLPGSPAIDTIPWGANGCGTTIFSDQRGQARPQPAGGACDSGAYEVEVADQPLAGWVSGLTPQTVVCTNVTTEHAVTLSHPAPPWNCEAAGLQVAAGDRVSMRVRGPVQQGATDVGGAVVGMAPSSGGCTNLATGQQVTFQRMTGATAASCGAAGLVVHPGDQVQMRVQGAAE